MSREIRFGSVAWQNEFEGKIAAKVLAGSALDFTEKLLLTAQAKHAITNGRTMMGGYPKYIGWMTPILQKKKVGNFAIERATLPKGEELQCYNRVEGRMFHAKFDRPAVITRLVEGGKTWMSDTPMEAESLAGALLEARGDILTAGLGMGFFALLAATSPTTRHIDIIEKESQVIELVYPQIADLMPNVRIIEGDLYDYAETTDKKYDFVYVDTWASITAPILEAGKANLAVSGVLKPQGKVFCWLQELYETVKDKLPNGALAAGTFGIHEPCMVCGKTLRADYAGLCMDCADSMGVSEIFGERGKHTGIRALPKNSGERGFEDGQKKNLVSQNL